MNPRLMYLCTVAFAALALLLVAVNGVMLHSSRSLQAEINQRAGQINAGGTFAQVFQGLVQSLAQVAVKQKDGQIRELLVANGFTFTDDKPQQGAQADAPKPAEPKKK